MKYKKKQLVIESINYQDLIAANKGLKKEPQWIIDAFENGTLFWNEYTLNVNTLEGVMRVESTDYIIKGIKGELYPCKKDIFEDSYDAEDNELYQALFEHDATAQLIVAIEEFSELQKELTKYLRGKGDINNIRDEVADAQNMINQIKFFFKLNDEEIDKIISQKMERTKRWLND